MNKAGPSRLVTVPSITWASPCHSIAWLGAVFVFLVSCALYIATLAPGPVPGDPSEYIFVPYILGIAHPPGYAFYTLTAKLWQTVVPLGSVAYRTNLLAAFAGGLIVALVYAIVWQITVPIPAPRGGRFSRVPDLALLLHGGVSALPALFAALSAMAGVDVWQHAIHSNAHILTALLAMVCIFLLVRWRRTQHDRWLYAAALVAGLCLTHHPILAFGFPAYAVFVLLVRPRILLQPRKLMAVILAMALGLAPFLYYPLRGPSAPFNPLPTPDAMLIHVTARGLTVNLFPFALRDQPTRLIVFWELLRLQYPLVTLGLAALGVAGLAARRSPWLALLGVFLLVELAFILNTIQDVLAYLMPSFIVVALLAGVGLATLVEIGLRLGYRRIAVAAAVVLLVAPLSSAATHLPRVSLLGFHAGDEWVDAVFEQFAGKRQHAVLLAEWEALTPLWVAQYTQGRVLDPADVKLVYVAATSKNPWLDAVFAHWDQGPVYLASFRRPVWEGGLFRLRPEGRWPLWRVVAPGNPDGPAEALTPLGVAAENQIELLSFSLDSTRLGQGETAHLTLAMRALVTPTDYLMPFALAGEREYRWTTDSRSLSPTWHAGEVIVERYDVTIPFGAPSGERQIKLGVSNLSQGRDLELSSGGRLVSLGSIQVEPARGITPPSAALEAAIANFNSEIGLMGATARAGSHSARAPWSQPLTARPGQAIDLWLDWRALKRPGASYKVFVHLIRNDQLAAPAADYYTPLGGAFPTYLWIPVWIEGQRVSDPNRLTLPATLAPGDYAIEIGLYELLSARRAPLVDRAGNLAGDRVILGPVRVN